MPKEKIPCKECAKRKKQIKLTPGTEFVSCNEISGKKGWCMLVWRRKRKAPKKKAAG